MQENLNDLRAFVVVARLNSFTKAGAQLGVSASALSHCIKGLEERLQLKLFHRTTRSIATTQAGEQLFQSLAPLLDDINQRVNDLSTFRHTLKGTLRINGNDHVFIHTLWDKIAAFMQQYPEIELELVSEMKFSDIVCERFDAGIRLGDDVEKDMVAVRIAPDMQMCTAASPDYLKKHGTPSEIEALATHQCVRVRLPTSGGVMQWEFIRANHQHHAQNTIKFTPRGQLTASSGALLHKTALAGMGIIWTPKDSIIKELSNGDLVEILPQYAIRYDGYHLYYPSRKQHSPVFGAFIEAMRQ